MGEERRWTWALSPFGHSRRVVPWLLVLGRTPCWKGERCPFFISRWSRRSGKDEAEERSMLGDVGLECLLLPKKVTNILPGFVLYSDQTFAKNLRVRPNHFLASMCLNQLGCHSAIWGFSQSANGLSQGICTPPGRCGPKVTVKGWGLRTEAKPEWPKSKCS